MIISRRTLLHGVSLALGGARLPLTPKANGAGSVLMVQIRYAFRFGQRGSLHAVVARKQFDDDNLPIGRCVYKIIYRCTLHRPQNSSIHNDIEFYQSSGNGVSWELFACAYTNAHRTVLLSLCQCECECVWKMYWRVGVGVVRTDQRDDGWKGREKSCGQPWRERFIVQPPPYNNSRNSCCYYCPTNTPLNIHQLTLC